jgi:CHAD domain-containing protein
MYLSAHTDLHRYLFAPMATVLHTHARKALKRLDRSLAAVSEHPDHRRVHGLRITLKTVRTLLQLAASMSPPTRPPEGATKRLMALFKAAGAQREPEVSAKVLGTITGHDLARKAFKAHLDDRARKAHKGLQKAVQAFSRRDSERLMVHFTAISRSMTRTQELRAADRYIAAERDAARRQLHADSHDGSLHEARKHLKNAWHTLRLLEQTGELEAGQVRLKEDLGQLQEALGDWHDLHVIWTELATRGSTITELRNDVEARLNERRRLLVGRLKEVLGK